MNLALGIILSLIILPLVFKFFANRRSQYPTSYSLGPTSYSLGPASYSLGPASYSTSFLSNDVNNNATIPNNDNNTTKKYYISNNQPNSLISTVHQSNNNSHIFLPAFICESTNIMHLPRQVAEGYQDSNLPPDEIQLPAIEKDSSDQNDNQYSNDEKTQSDSSVDYVNWTSGKDRTENNRVEYTPMEEYNLLIQEFGTPKFLDKEKGGSATWKKPELRKKGLCWESVTIQDIPKDFIEIKYYIPINAQFGQNPQIIINQLKLLNPSLNYHQTHQILVAQGNSLNNIVALLVVGKRFLSGEINYQQAEQLIILLMNKLDRFSSNYDYQLYNSLIDELCSTQYRINNKSPIINNYSNNLSTQSFYPVNPLLTNQPALHNYPSVQNPNVSVQNPNTYVQNPNSYIQNPNSYIQNPNLSVQNPNSYLQNPNSYIQNPNLSVQNPNLSVSNPYMQNPNPYMQNLNPYMQNPNLSVSNPYMQNPNPNPYTQNPYQLPAQCRNAVCAQNTTQPTIPNYNQYPLTAQWGYPNGNYNVQSVDNQYLGSELSSVFGSPIN